MSQFTRRDTLRLGAGTLASGGLLCGTSPLARAAAGEMPAPGFRPEPGASLRVLGPPKVLAGGQPAGPAPDKVRRRGPAALRPEHAAVHRADRRRGRDRLRELGGPPA